MDHLVLPRLVPVKNNASPSLDLCPCSRLNMHLEIQNEDDSFPSGDRYSIPIGECAVGFDHMFVGLQIFYQYCRFNRLPK